MSLGGEMSAAWLLVQVGGRKEGGARARPNLLESNAIALQKNSGVQIQNPILSTSRVKIGLKRVILDLYALVRTIPSVCRRQMQRA